MSTNYIREIYNLIRDNNLSIVSGSYMSEFETEAAEMFGHKYGVSTCNGTSSLYLALFCLSLENSRKEVILPAYGFHGMLSVVCAFGLKPVFCDVDLETYTLDFDQCEKLINKNTLAVIVLHPWGNLANLDKIPQIRKKHGVFFISDSSHAHEATWNKKPTGGFFDITCASFGLGKLVSGGELGIMATDNAIFRDRALLFSHTNRVPCDLITDNYKDINNAVGIKFRPHIIALLLALNDLINNKNKRLLIRNNIKNFQEKMSSFTKKNVFQKSFVKSQRVFWMPTVDLGSMKNMRSLIKDLTDSGFTITNHKFDTVLNKMTIFTNFYHLNDYHNYPNSENISKKHIIHLLDRDFLDDNKVLKIEQIFRNYLK